MELSRADKARNFRYRRAALAIMQRDTINDDLYDIASECSELEWTVEDDETLLDVFDGDTDEIHDFRMMFADLSNKCESLQSALQEEYVTDHFDDFFVGSLGKAYRMVGYDSMEEDYFSLTRFEAGLAQGVSGKRLMGLTKEKLIAVGGQCIGIMMCFLDIRHSYACLKATFDVLRDDRTELLKGVKMIEDAYQKAQDDPYGGKARREYESLLYRLPDRVWVE
jgi:hypothetical protein